MVSIVNRYKCDFCRRAYASRSYALKHEKICFANTDREIKEGALAIFNTLPNALKQENSYDVPGSGWQEPMEKCFDSLDMFNNIYRWWPKTDDGELALGFVYRNGKWVKMDSYVPPNFAPGFYWKEEVFDAAKELDI